MSGRVTSGAVLFSYETRLEPPSPPMTGVSGGISAGRTGTYRYMIDNSRHAYLGYDLAIERGKQSGAYVVTFRPLSVSAWELVSDATGWKALRLPGYPAPQTVRVGDTIALDLMTNPATGQKIVDYIRIEGRQPETSDVRELALTKTVDAEGKLTIHIRNRYSHPATAYTLTCHEERPGGSRSAYNWFDADLSPLGKRLGPGEETEFSPGGRGAQAGRGQAPGLPRDGGRFRRWHCRGRFQVDQPDNGPP